MVSLEGCARRKLDEHPDTTTSIAPPPDSIVTAHRSGFRHNPASRPVLLKADRSLEHFRD